MEAYGLARPLVCTAGAIADTLFLAASNTKAMTSRTDYWDLESVIQTKTDRCNPLIPGKPSVCAQYDIQRRLRVNRDTATDMGGRAVDRNAAREKRVGRGRAGEDRRTSCRRIEQFVAQTRMHFRRNQRSICQRNHVNQALKKHGYRSIAIATLAQFEFVERRISIIGAWERKTWRAGCVWDGVCGRNRVGISADWIISYTQNKVGEVAREFDLKATPLLLQLLQQTPESERSGPVIVCETTGRPCREKHYTDTFREIARAAALPDSFWSMDMRAGGATETDALPGITARDLKNASGWSSDVYQRYTRAPQRRAQNAKDAKHLRNGFEERRGTSC
jgi:hypothetical protein